MAHNDEVNPIPQRHNVPVVTNMSGGYFCNAQMRQYEVGKIEGFAVTVAKWEFQALAHMLVATYGLGAESEAKNRLDIAQRNGDSGGAVVWSEVLDRLPALIEKYRSRHDQS